MLFVIGMNTRACLLSLKFQEFIVLFSLLYDRVHLHSPVNCITFLSQLSTAWNSRWNFNQGYFESLAMSSIVWTWCPFQILMAVLVWGYQQSSFFLISFLRRIGVETRTSLAVNCDHRSLASGTYDFDPAGSQGKCYESRPWFAHFMCSSSSTSRSSWRC